MLTCELGGPRCNSSSAVSRDMVEPSNPELSVSKFPPRISAVSTAVRSSQCIYIHRAVAATWLCLLTRFLSRSEMTVRHLGIYYPSRQREFVQLRIDERNHHVISTHANEEKFIDREQMPSPAFDKRSPPSCPTPATYVVTQYVNPRTKKHRE